MNHTAALSECRRVTFLLSLAFVYCAPLWAAVEQGTERVTDVASIEQKIGRVKVHGSGKFSGDAVRLRGGTEIHRLFNSPAFLATEGRFDQERRLPYDLRHWGGDLGWGWALTEATNVLAKYRLDSYKVLNIGSNVDPAFRSVAGRTEVSALGLVLRHDTRDDTLYPTHGLRAQFGGELAIEALGGDYDFGRLDSDVSVYLTPLRETQLFCPYLQELTFVEHLRFGWVAAFGDTDDVPFFERYFVGGSNTVRGHRSRWLTPRGLEQQFVGGEIQVINNVEARLPIVRTLFNRQLSAAAFFDTGRSYRRFSDVGDFGYGLGVGLRYVVHLWKLPGVIRTDYGFSLDNEGDDSRARFHVTVGMPF